MEDGFCRHARRNRSIVRGPRYTSTSMNITRRRGAIAFFITLGTILVGLTITQSAWILLNERTVAFAILGIILFAALIASIRLYLESLQRRSVDEPQRQEFYKIMLSDSDRLLATVEQVLKAGQLGQRHRQQNRTVINLESLVADCITITLQRHHLLPDSIVLEPVPGAVRLYTRGIAEDLRTAVINVLDNAVKYSPEGVHIRCSLAIVNYTSIALTITDTGVGLDSSQFKRIFKRFYRVPGRSIAKIKGTGLGLFLVRNIARQHGGDATATSPGPGLGTTITITLPLATENTPRITLSETSSSISH